MIWAIILGYALLIFVVLEGVLRLPAKVQAALWGVIPLLLLPVYLGVAEEYEFTKVFWAKVAVIFSSCVAVFAAIAWVKARKVIIVGSWLLILPNMLMMAAGGAKQGNWLNALAALFLTVAISNWSSPRVQEHKGRQLLLVDLSWIWILAYTCWAFTTVFHMGPEVAGRHLSVHLAGLALTLRLGRECYITMRLVTVGMHFLLGPTNYGLLLEHFNTTPWANPTLIQVLSGISVALALVACGERFLGRSAASGEASPPAEGPAGAAD